MNFILRNWVIFYTKEVLKALKLIVIGTGLILTVVIIKYKPAYEVTMSGQNLGCVESKEFIENKINKYINSTAGNIAFREISNLPEYKMKLVDRKQETSEKEVMLAIENSTVTTYRMFAVTVAGEQKAVVETAEKAQSIIDEVKKDVNKNIDLELGFLEVYTTDNKINSEEETKNILNESKKVKIAAYEKERRMKNASRARSTTTKAPATGNLSGLALAIPVNGSVSSRFGSRSASRSSIHTGIDISTSMGTGIRAVAPGTVTYSGYKGTYGYLIIIDHGNGVESYYAHCNALYVGVGQVVDSNTTIAAVGSTGNSTGPHLHLELRINGSPVNPQGYLYR